MPSGTRAENRRSTDGNPLARQETPAFHRPTRSVSLLVTQGRNKLLPHTLPGAESTCSIPRLARPIETAVRLELDRRNRKCSWRCHQESVFAFKHSTLLLAALNHRDLAEPTTPFAPPLGERSQPCRLRRQPVLESESEFGVTFLDLLHPLLDHDQVAAVADKRRPQIQQPLRMLGRATDRPPPLARILRRSGNRFVGFGD